MGAGLLAMPELCLEHSICSVSTCGVDEFLKALKPPQEGLGTGTQRTPGCFGGFTPSWFGLWFVALLLV